MRPLASFGQSGGGVSVGETRGGTGGLVRAVKVEGADVLATAEDLRGGRGGGSFRATSSSSGFTIVSNAEEWTYWAQRRAQSRPAACSWRHAHGRATEIPRIPLRG
jgi:hypothetical protein